MKTSKIRKSAKGEDCLVRAPGICNGNPETVVLAHINGGGMGRKNPDWQAAYACSACHEWLDGGYNRESTKPFRDLLHLEAVIRTQSALIDKGLITVRGAA